MLQKRCPCCYYRAVQRHGLAGLQVAIARRRARQHQKKAAGDISGEEDGRIKKGQNTTALPVQGEKAGNIVPEENTPVAADALSEKIRELYGTSRFRANFLPFQIDAIACGHCEISLKLEQATHADEHNEVHSGVLAAFADAVLTLTAASVGEIATPVSFSINFIQNVSFDSTVRMISEIRHHGRTTMVISGEMYDEKNRMLATMQATMMNKGKIEGVPREW